MVPGRPPTPTWAQLHLALGMASQLTGEISWMEKASCWGWMYRSSAETVEVVRGAQPREQTQARASPTSLDGLELLLLARHAWDAGAWRVGARGDSIHLGKERASRATGQAQNVPGLKGGVQTLDSTW